MAELDQYSLVQNMARSYALSLSKDSDINADFDFKNYFIEESREAYLIKIYSDIAGFVLVNQVTFSKISNLNLGEFIILDKYLRLGIGRQAAKSYFYIINILFKQSDSWWYFAIVKVRVLTLITVERIEKMPKNTLLAIAITSLFSAYAVAADFVSVEKSVQSEFTSSNSLMSVAVNAKQRHIFSTGGQKRPIKAKKLEKNKQQGTKADFPIYLDWP